MSDKESGNDQGNDSCQVYQDYGDAISEQRDNCDTAACAVAVDFNAAAAYFAASSCYDSKK